MQPSIAEACASDRTVRAEAAHNLHRQNGAGSSADRLPTISSSSIGLSCHDEYPKLPPAIRAGCEAPLNHTRPSAETSQEVRTNHVFALDATPRGPRAKGPRPATQFRPSHSMRIPERGRFGAGFSMRSWLLAAMSSGLSDRFSPRTSRRVAFGLGAAVLHLAGECLHHRLTCFGSPRREQSLVKRCGVRSQPAQAARL